MSTVLAAPSSVQETLGIGDVRLYGVTALMVAGNVALPSLVHALPGGGQAFLPILFFTLVVAWRHGLLAGLATALASPLVNHALTGMPPVPVLGGILLQSAILAVLAARIARSVTRTTPAALACVVGIHQALWVLGAAVTAGAPAALALARTHAPAILLQVLGGYLVLAALERFAPARDAA